MATTKITLNELRGIIKQIIKEETSASFQNKFVKTNSETEKASMTRVYGDADDFPTELNSIIFKFAGNYENFAITQDGDLFNVYSWRRLLDGVKKINSFKNIEDAKKMIVSKN